MTEIYSNFCRQKLNYGIMLGSYTEYFSCCIILGRGAILHHYLWDVTDVVYLERGPFISFLLSKEKQVSWESGLASIASLKER